MGRDRGQVDSAPRTAGTRTAYGWYADHVRALRGRRTGGTLDRQRRVQSCLRLRQDRVIRELRRSRLRRANAAADDQALRAGQGRGDLGLDRLGEHDQVTVRPHLRAAGGWAEEDALVALAGLELQPRAPQLQQPARRVDIAGVRQRAGNDRNVRAAFGTGGPRRGSPGAAGLGGRCGGLLPWPPGADPSGQARRQCQGGGETE